MITGVDQDGQTTPADESDDEDVNFLMGGACRVDYWPSLVKVQKLCIAAIPVLFRHDYSQMMAIILVLLVYLCILSRKAPYVDRVLNNLEVAITVLLLLLSTFSIINTTYLTSKDDNIRDFLKMIDLAKFVILLLPLPMLICLKLFQQCCHTSSDNIDMESFGTEDANGDPNDNQQMEMSFINENADTFESNTGMN